MKNTPDSGFDATNISLFACRTLWATARGDHGVAEHLYAMVKMSRLNFGIGDKPLAFIPHVPTAERSIAAVPAHASRMLAVRKDNAAVEERGGRPAAKLNP